MADRLNQFCPLDLSNQPERSDDVADRKIGCNLNGLSFTD